MQYLPGADAVAAGLVGFDILYRAGFPSPGMVNQEFSIDTKQLVQQFFMVNGAAGNIPHGK